MTPHGSSRWFDDPGRRSDSAHSRCEAPRRRCGWRRDGSCASRVSRSCARGRHRRRERRGDVAGEPVRPSPPDRRCRGAAARRTRVAARTTCVRRFVAVVFGAGDFRTPTEHRPHPPVLQPGDGLQLGPLRADVVRVLAHPRLIEVRFHGSVEDIWAGVARHGRPIQYAYLSEPLAIWDTWTRIAGQPVAFEPPSAGFILDWTVIRLLRSRGARFATLTHAAGISSTGDSDLDRLLPFDEPYHIPSSTATLIASGRQSRTRDCDWHNRRTGPGACGAP